MKRVLFFALLVGCISYAQSQVLTVSYNNEAVPEGDTLSLTVTSGDEIQFRPAFHNNSSANMVCKISTERLNNTTTEVWSICTGLLCMSGNMSAPFTIAANSTYDDVHIDFAVPQDAPMGLFKINVFDTANTNVNTFFFAKVYPKVGFETVDNNASFNAYPNPATSVANIVYSNNTDNGRLVVYNMTGMLVREVALESGDGTASVNVSDLPSGVYMYGVSNGKNKPTMKKLVVK